MAAGTKGSEGIADISEIAIDNLAPSIYTPTDYLILFHCFLIIITHTYNAYPIIL